MSLIVFCLRLVLQIQNILIGSRDTSDYVNIVFVNTSSDSPAVAVAELPQLSFPLSPSCKKTALVRRGDSGHAIGKSIQNLFKNHHSGIVSGYILCVVQSALPVEMQRKTSNACYFSLTSNCC